MQSVGGGGSQVCLYFEDAEHGHIIPGLDLNILMLVRRGGTGSEVLASPQKRYSFFLSCKNSLMNQLVAFLVQLSIYKGHPK